MHSQTKKSTGILKQISFEGAQTVMWAPESFVVFTHLK